MLLSVLACAPEVVLGGANLPDTGSAPSDAGTLPPQTCAGYSCQYPVAEGTSIGFHDLVVDETGAAWMSWVELEYGFPERMFVARSPAAGQAFEPPVEVPVPEPPIVGSSERPTIDVHDGRLVLGFTGSGAALRHGDAYAAYVLTASVDGGVVAWDPVAVVDTTDGGGWVMEQVTVGLAHDEAFAVYKRQIYGTRDVATLARESGDYAHAELSEELSQRHECSPPDVLVDRAGDQVYVALRSNIEGWLHTVVLSETSPGVFGPPVQLPSGPWAYNELVCPNDGPRIAKTADDTLVVTWVGPEDDGAGQQSVILTSTDDGLTWSEPAIDMPDPEADDANPTVTALQDGRLLTTVSSRGETWLAERDSVDSAPVTSLLEAPIGGPLTLVQVATSGSRTVAAGVGDDGRIWLVEL